MRIVIRSDASLEIGTGHIMRCIVLADELKKNGCSISFVCRDIPGNKINFIREKGYDVRQLSSVRDDDGVAIDGDAYFAWLNDNYEIDLAQTLKSIDGHNNTDWFVIDHYGLDYKWEEQLKQHARKMLVIDDLANRRHDCDMLLDQNLSEEMMRRYDGLLHRDCLKVVGPSYALLRDEYRKERKRLRKRDGTISNILILFGGSDLSRETEKGIDAIRLLGRLDIEAHVVVGDINPYKEQIELLCMSFPNCHYHCQIDNVAELMVQADISVGAGGTTTWERCCLGLPALIISVASNQVSIARNVDKYGAGIYLGRSCDVKASEIHNTLKKLLGEPELIRQMSESSMRLVDGSGKEKVASLILNRTFQI